MKIKLTLTVRRATKAARQLLLGEIPGATIPSWEGFDPLMGFHEIEASPITRIDFSETTIFRERVVDFFSLSQKLVSVHLFGVEIKNKGLPTIWTVESISYLLHATKPTIDDDLAHILGADNSAAERIVVNVEGRNKFYSYIHKSTENFPPDDRVWTEKKDGTYSRETVEV